MSWIPTSILAPLPGCFAQANLVSSNDPERPVVEAFIKRIYWERYGAALHSFLPHLLAYRDTDGNLLAAVGLRLGSEGGLFVEQYLDGRAEHVPAQRQIATVPRTALAEVGNFAAQTPGTARELIPQLTWTLQFRQIAQDRNAGVLVVTHEPRALEMLDRVIQIVDGRISTASA